MDISQQGRSSCKTSQSKVQHSSGQEATWTNSTLWNTLEINSFSPFFPSNIIKMVILLCCSFLELTKILKQKCHWDSINLVECLSTASAKKGGVCSQQGVAHIWNITCWVPFPPRCCLWYWRLVISSVWRFNWDNFQNAEASQKSF